MVRLRTPILCFLLAVVVLALTGRAALAAPPSNDTFGGATPISSLPFHDTTATTESTLDADDTAVGTVCGIGEAQPSTSVWYAYTPSSTTRVKIDTGGSSYPVGAGIVTGSPGNFSAKQCFAGSTSVTLEAGTTYYLDFVDLDGQGGGTLDVSMTELPALDIDLQVDPSGHFNPKTGVATVTGSITCKGADSGFVQASLSQSVGRVNTIAGFGSLNFANCDGTPQRWSTVILPNSGKFAGGKAKLMADALLFGDDGYASDRVETTVTLKR